MGPFDVEPPLREGDPFLDTVISVWAPVYGALGAQDATALTALSERYPVFREAYALGRQPHILISRPTIFRRRHLRARGGGSGALPDARL